MRAIAVVLSLAFATASAAQGMNPPRVTTASVDWTAARQALNVPDALRGALAPIAGVRLQAGVKDRIVSDATSLGLLNQATSGIFPNAALSPLPVLMPFDTEAFVNDVIAGGKQGPKKTSAYLSGFAEQKFFLPGQSGYDAAFLLRIKDVSALGALQYQGNVEVQISGSAVLYELGNSALPAGEPVANLQSTFPGIRRVVQEGSQRYTFVRYGAPYLVSIDCSTGNATSKTMTCGEANRVVEHFLNALRIVGGTPATKPSSAAAQSVERPWRTSSEFTYHPAGSLLPNSGYQQGSGTKDSTVYAKIRFPVARAPAYANSQIFTHGGHCYGEGVAGPEPKPERKNQTYRCKINDIELSYFEGHEENYDYPWRDNFCEWRDHLVGQCAKGKGHQGQDIRPADCQEHPRNNVKCKPYRHDLVAVRNAYVLRSKGQQAVYLVINEPNEHIRFRYLHMSPEKMDKDGLLTKRYVTEGEVIGQMGNYMDTENGTTVHVHFDVQVPTRNGWVWVSPYMTLVSAYERLIGAKGTEITESAPVTGSIDRRASARRPR